MRHRAREWTDGWLPFPLHDESVHQSAVIAARRTMSAHDEEGEEGGWRKLLRKENGYSGDSTLRVDKRLLLEHGRELELSGTALTFPQPSIDAPFSTTR